MSRLVIKLFSPNGSPAAYLISSRSITQNRFRQGLGLPSTIAKTREFQELKEYSFTNGKPSPVTPAQLKRIKRQRELATLAVQHLKEIKFIEERWERKMQGKLEEKQSIIENKLQPKGNLLLKKPSTSEPVEHTTEKMD